MSQAWVEQTSYVGPCRRCGKQRFRLTERRVENTAGEPPSLAAVLRRLRVQVGHIQDDDRLLLTAHLHAAIALAENAHQHDCTRVLEHLARAAGSNLPKHQLEQVFAEGLTAALSMAQGAKGPEA
jgi:hypothetical protein